MDGHDGGYLFDSVEFFSVQASQTEQLKGAIDGAAPRVFEEGSIDEVADRFVQQFRLEAPELTEGAISVDVE